MNSRQLLPVLALGVSAAGLACRQTDPDPGPTTVSAANTPPAPSTGTEIALNSGARSAGPSTKPRSRTPSVVARSAHASASPRVSTTQPR